MGKGNVCVFGKFEGLYYVDRDYIDFYVPIDGEADDGKFLGELSMSEFPDYEYDEFLSGIYYDDFIQNFTSMMEKKFNSTKKVARNTKSKYQFLRNKRTGISRFFFIAA